jgi:hypothetical protein
MNNRLKKGMRSRGLCVCPKCGNETLKTPGIPCQSLYCTKCKCKLLRKGSPHHLQWQNKRGINENSISH